MAITLSLDVVGSTLSSFTYNYYEDLVGKQVALSYVFADASADSGFFATEFIRDADDAGFHAAIYTGQDVSGQKLLWVAFRGSEDGSPGRLVDAVDAGQLGFAHLLISDEVRAWQYFRQTIVSLSDPRNVDLAEYSLALGFPANQTELAIRLVDALQVNPDNDPTTIGELKGEFADHRIVFTGHSLGGGLAGYMADLTGETAYIYDAMPHQLAILPQAIASAIYDAAVVSNLLVTDVVIGLAASFDTLEGRIIASRLSGLFGTEFMANFREALADRTAGYRASNIVSVAADGEGLASTRQTLNASVSALERIFSDIFAIGSGDAVETTVIISDELTSDQLHDIRLLSLALWADEVWTPRNNQTVFGDRDWREGVYGVLPRLLVGEAEDGGDGEPEAATGAGNPLDFMDKLLLTAIAPTAGFGDAAASALFSDMSDWSAKRSGETDSINNLYDVVPHWIDQYVRQAVSSARTAEGTGLANYGGGFLYYQKSNTSESMSIDMTNYKWGNLAPFVRSDVITTVLDGPFYGGGYVNVTAIAGELLDWMHDELGRSWEAIDLITFGLGDTRFISTQGLPPSTGQYVLSMLSDVGQVITRGGAVDLIAGGSGADDIDGGGGNDFLHGGSGNDILYGRRGRDLLSGGDGTDTLFGGEGNDRLFGGGNDGGRDQLFGEAGDDELSFAGGYGVARGGRGNDIINLVDSLDVQIYYADGDGADKLIYEDILDRKQGADFAELFGPSYNPVEDFYILADAWYLGASSERDNTDIIITSANARSFTLQFRVLDRSEIS